MEIEDGEFVWNEHLQALVSGSFFWSYSVVQLFSGRLAEKFGTKVMSQLLINATIQMIHWRFWGFPC